MALVVLRAALHRLGVFLPHPLLPCCHWRLGFLTLAQPLPLSLALSCIGRVRFGEQDQVGGKRKPAAEQDLHRARRREDSTEDHLKGRNGCAAYPQSGRVIGAFFVDERLVGLAPQLRIEDCLLAPVVDCLGPPQHPGEGGNVDDGEAEVDDVPAPPSADCVVQRTAPAAPRPRRGRHTRRAGATRCNRG